MGGQNICKLGNSDVNVFVKTSDGREKRLNFAIFVVWSVSYVSAKSLNPFFMGNPLTIIPTFLAFST